MAKKLNAEIVEIVPERELRAKQKRFVDEYVIDFNGEAAAVRAGYKPGSRVAAKLLADDNINREIQKRQAALSKQDAVDAKRVMTELKAIAFDPECSVQYRLVALKLLGQHYGHFTERIVTDNTIHIEVAQEIKEIGQ